MDNPQPMLHIKSRYHIFQYIFVNMIYLQKEKFMKMSICNFENYIKSHYKCYYMNNVETYYYISKNGRVYNKYARET